MAKGKKKKTEHVRFEDLDESVQAQVIEKSNAAAIDFGGSIAQVARGLGVTGSLLSHRMKRHGWMLTPEDAITYERYTLGAVPRFLTRPDLWPSDQDPVINAELAQLRILAEQYNHTAYGINPKLPPMRIPKRNERL